MSALLPILLVAHVSLALALVVPSLLLPFALRAQRRPAVESGSSVVRFLVLLQHRGTVAIGAALAATGVGLVLSLGTELLAQPWLLAALGIYAATLLIAWFVQRPGLLALVGLRGAWDDALWQARARRQRYLSYAIAGLVGTIGFLMTTKPRLW
jgi:hypothetical protein